jgi:single-strand DNA-binding protein
MSVNKVYLLGNVGQTPELKTAKNGKAFCKLSVATSDKHVQENGEEVEKTTWHHVHVFGQQAEWACSHLQKGHRVFVEACLEKKTEETPEGQKKSNQFIRAFHVTSFTMSPALVS